MTAILDHPDLVRYLGAAKDRHERTSGVVHERAQGLDLSRHQVASVGGKMLGNACGGGMSPVRGSKGVVHIEIAERRKLARQSIVVLLFARFETNVFEQQHIARS
ncbi:MAG: hypothetical protein R2848_16230 [Thermomicrobiales bacterium]